MNNEIYIENSLYFDEFEQLKIEQIKHRNAKDNYVSGRLAGKLAVAAFCGFKRYDHLIIQNGVLGQPILRNADMPCELSISHSTELTIAGAFDRKLLCGVDLETLNKKNSETIAHALTQKEKALLKKSTALTEQVCLNSFWAAKESLAKLLKIGFSNGLDIFELQNVTVENSRIAFSFCHFPNLRTDVIDLNQYVFAISYPRIMKMQLNAALLQECVHLLLCGGSL